MGRRVPEYDIDEMREILVFKWRVVYHVSDYDVDVIEIIHGAQRWRGE